MFALRCTQRLLSRLGTPSTSLPNTTTRLGDATLILTRPQVVLAVSARALLPVLVPARNATALLGPRLQDAVGVVLRAIGVASSQVAAEQRAMEAMIIGRTASRQLLGSLNDFIRMYDGYRARDLSLLEAALHLADTPCGPLKMDSPRRVTVALFAAHTDVRT